MLLKKLKLKQFLIYAPPYNNGNRGGIVAMHYLCKVINEVGYEAYLHPATTRGDIITGGKMADSKIDPAKCVGIYSEQIERPLEKNKVAVRWQMYYQLPHIKKYEGWDYVVNYVKAYWPQAPQLRVTMCNLAYWVPAPRMQRKGNAGQYHKFPNVPIPKDCRLIDGIPNNHPTKLHTLQRAERFYSADPYSFNNVLAALCGAESIIVPREGFNVDKWRAEVDAAPLLNYGDADLIEGQREKAVQFVSDLHAKEREQVKEFCETLQ